MKPSNPKIISKKLQNLFSFLTIIGLTWSLIIPQTSAAAAANLTIEPITWNVIGLDSNNVNVGPNHFPIGARVCNTGPDPATNVTATFSLDGSNPYIGVRPGTNSSITIASLAANDCYDFYFEVQVERDSNAYDTTEYYDITVTADGGISENTPADRELYVEHLVSQNRNAVTDVRFATNEADLALGSSSVAPGGTMTMMVGNTYYIRLIGFTATQGYEQLESFINIPNTIFQVETVSTTYTADSSATVSSPNDKAYGDACTWENDTTDPNYRSCLSTGKVGGDITVTYKVTILQVPSAPLVNPEPLSTLIYDFSGSSYHYNSDYGVSTRYAYIVNAGVEKSFSPKTITPGNNSTLTFTINNPGAEQIDDVNFTDDLPANVSLANANVSYTGCGTPSPTSGSLTDPLTFTNITVAASSTCTIAVTVTSNTTGTYANTTGTLKIGATDTGDTASDTLVVSSSPAPPSTCTSSTTLATWNFNSLSTGINSGPFAGTTSGTASGATTSYGSGGGSSSGIANSTSNTFAGDPSGFVNPVALDGNTWGIQEGWSSSGTPTGSTTPYFQFQVNAIDYGGLVLTASANLGGSWSNGDNWYVLASTDGTNWTQRGTGAWGTTGYKNNWGSVSNNTSTPANAATTYFRIIFVGSQSGKADDTVFLDNVSISGCSNPPPPTISKSFQTDPISVASASTLTFTIDNTTSGADNLTGVSFTDVLPGGLVINTPNSLSTNCSGTVTATAGTSTISWSGSLTANNSCTISVSIKGNTAGSYTNTTTNITATESGANTSTTPNVGFGQDTLTVIAPPVIAKSFTANPIFTGNTTYLNFSINNPNTSTALTNIAFTDNLPSGLVVDTTTTAPATPATSTCGGTLTANDGALSVQLSGVNSLAAGDTCTITVRVRGTTTGLKSNFVTVSSSNGGTGNTATASVLVKDPEPKISLLKSVGPTSTGPWTPSLTVTIPGNVYYRLLVENIGDVALSAVNVTDPDVSTSGCSWVDGDGTVLGSAPLTLPVANANDDQIATCILGPVNAEDGSNPNTATASGTYNTTTVTDDSTATYTGSAPNLGLTKNDGVTSVAGSSTPTYTLTVANNGNVATSGTITVVDVLPSGMTISDSAGFTPGGTNGINWNCVAASNVITCASNTVIAGGSTSVFSFQVTVDASPPSVMTNQAQVGGGNDPTNSSAPTSTTAGQCTGTDTPNEGCAVDTDTANSPNLGLAKTDGVTSVTAGGATSYSLTVTNNGSADTSGTVTVVDVPPAGLTVTAISGTGWTCTLATLTCTRSDVLSPLNSYPDIIVDADVDATATGTLTNQAQVGGGGDPSNPSAPTSTTAGQCTGTDTLNKGCAVDSNAVNYVDLDLVKSNGATVITAGSTTTYTLTVTNSGNISTGANTITVVDVLPTGLSITDNANFTPGGTNGTDWTCAAASNVITCTSTTAIAASGGTSAFNLTVNVSASASGSLTNPAQVGGGGDPTNPNPPTSTTAGQCTGTNTPNEGCAVDTDTVNSPSLGLTKSNGSNTLLAGGTTTYDMVVTNGGNVATSGTITLVDVLPTGLSVADGALTIGGTNSANWTCTAASNVITCTSSTVIAASGGTSVFNFTVNVAANASGTLTNPAQVGGGGDPSNPNPPDSTTAGQCTGTDTPNKGCAVDSDTVNAPSLGLSKSNGSSSITPGGTTTYTLTVTNSGDTSTVGTITVKDVLPTGLSVSDGAVTTGGADGADWTCTASSNVITCTSTTAIAGSNGTSVFNFTVNVEASATGTITNPAQVGGGGDPLNPNPPTNSSAGACTGSDTPTQGCAVDSDSASAPNLGLAKDNGGTTLSPGGMTTYTLTVTNNGNMATSGTITVVDVLPTGLSISDNAGFTPGGTNGADWSCVAASDVITCTSSIAIAGSGSASVFSITVNVDAGATGTITNPAQVGGGGDPTNPNPPTASTAGACTGTNAPNEGCATDADSIGFLFDPPSGTKTFSEVGLPQLEFRMVWINSSNVAAINVQITDNIPAGTTYVAGSILCEPRGSSSTVDVVAVPIPVSPLVAAVPTWSCGYDAANNRVQWQGTIGPDDGNLTEATAANEVVITFRVTVDDSVNQVNNVGSSRTDVDADGNFDEETVLNVSAVNSNTVTWTRGVAVVADPQELPEDLPKTGFAPNRITVLPEQPAEKTYRATELLLSIPRLGLVIPIVGVPIADEDWDITWLWDEAGWLEGTAFPSWQGNSVLTGHVTLPNGEAGPFASLSKLSWGDRILVHAYGTVFTYEVRQNRTVSPSNTSVFQHEDESWLTLLTCKTYNEATDTYTSRLVVRAVLISTAKDKSSSGKNVR